MLLKSYLELSKIRLTGMVLITAAVGFVLGSPGPLDFARLGWTILGTGLAAAGASAFNQLLEIRRDAVMRRTRGRPLPSGQISALHGLLFAMVASLAGVGVLNELVNPLTAFLGLANIVIYAMIYTPLKPRTSLSTLVGAVCGALPPIMGWTAASGEIGLGAVLLGMILFLWQIPHFLALAWMLRDDYAKAGFRMLPLIDPLGHLTCLMIVLYSLALLPMGLAVTVTGQAGYLFGAASLALGLGFFLLALKLRRIKTARNARRVFLASLVYLPLLMLFLVLDRQPRGDAALPGDSAPPTIADAKPAANLAIAATAKIDP
jgi:protoheme IX farnesyltransferase